jgi:hypothetical protein
MNEADLLSGFILSAPGFFLCVPAGDLWLEGEGPTLVLLLLVLAVPVPLSKPAPEGDHVGAIPVKT